MDPLSWTMLAYALIGLGAASIILAWPLESERREAWRIIRERFRR